MEYIVIDTRTGPHPTHTNDHIARFLEDHLDQFGDRKEDILKCLAYVFNVQKGGFLVLAVENGAIGGAVVVNETGMGG